VIAPQKLILKKRKMGETRTENASGYMVYIRNQKLKNLIINMEVDPILLGPFSNVQGLNLQRIADEYQERSENSSGLMKFYYRFKERRMRKRYENALSYTMMYLEKPRTELTRGLTLHFLDRSRENGGFIPPEIQEIMKELPRIDVRDERVFEPLLKEEIELRKR
jgi:hypothetical protein